MLYLMPWEMRCFHLGLKLRGGGVLPHLRAPESVFLDEGQGESGGVSYFANFLINLDQ